MGQVTIVVDEKTRDEQLRARTELRNNCRMVVANPECTSPDVTEQIAKAVLEYLDGEDDKGL